jgi:hypothetical protein
MTKQELQMRFKSILAELNADNSSVHQRFQEKGVECNILMPLLEYLGFDPIKDICFEHTSSERFDRFDFFVDNKLIIEAKKLNEYLSPKLKGQIEKYLTYHKQINFGILSNGLGFAFFMRKSFLEEYLKPNETFKISYNRDVFSVLNITIEEDDFFDVIDLFKKNCYQNTFSDIAKFAITIINQGRATKLVDDKELNKRLQDKIAQALDINHGALLKDIEEGHLRTNDIMKFENEFLRIRVTVQNDGRVELKKNSIEVLNFAKLIDSEFSPLITLLQGDWKNSNQIFFDSRDLIREATGKTKLSKDKYKFVRE